MSATIIPLGTASAMPAHGRHLSATALWRGGRLLLFDCGEGTQYRIKEADLKRSRIDGLFITHLHGDHCFGLPGLLSTLGMLQRTDPLMVVGPEGIQAFGQLPGLSPESLPFELTFLALPAGAGRQVVLDAPEYTITARPLEHRTLTFGYRFEEKPTPGALDAERTRALGVRAPEDFGRLKGGEAVTTPDGTTVTPAQVVGPEQPGAVFAYVTDTRPCAEGVHLAADADLVLHDATFGMTHHARAVETGHSTAREAARLAQRADARHLLLSHFSARYADTGVLEQEARTVFSNTTAAEELQRYALERHAQ